MLSVCAAPSPETIVLPAWARCVKRPMKFTVCLILLVFVIASQLTLSPVLRILSLQECIPEPLRPLSQAEVHDAIAKYLRREDDSLAALKAERRPGRPKSTKHTLLEQQQDLEKKEYESGFWMPDMQNESNLSKLRNWKGDWISLGPLAFVRVEKAGAIKESAFPPKGAA